MLQSDTIGNKITAARKKVNITQAQLAERLFISPQAVGKWERGESLPDFITFNRLAEILGVDLNYFSENFKSAAAEATPAETRTEQADETQSGEHGQSSGRTVKKLSWDMSRGNWKDADFSGLKNLQEKFSSSNMLRCLFTGSDLSGLLLNRNNVDSCDFSNSNFSNSHIKGSNFANNIFKNCSLRESDFSGSNILGCDFKDCSLEESEFSGSNIMNCDFTGADLRGVLFRSGGFQNNLIADTVWNQTSFNAMYIADVVFDGKIDNCYFENCKFKKVLFRNATLINTFFKNKNLKGIRFIDSYADRMTLEFLKNGKADLSGITLLKQEGGNE